MPTQQEIQNQINSLTTGSSVEEMFTLAAQTNEIDTDRTIVVSTVNELPDLLTVQLPHGTTYFVDQIKTLVMASYGRWVGLDGRVLRQDYNAGVIFGWGNNFCGRLANGNTTDQCYPVSVIGNYTDWCQISASNSTAAAIRRNGTLWAWGFNNGVIGDNTAVDRSSPVSVVGGFTDWCQVSVNGSAAAVRSNGTLWTWGSNSSGQLGDGTITSRSSPVSVVGGFTDWCQVSAGGSHTAAVRSNGTLWAWGSNTNGRLGCNGSSGNTTSPVSAVGGFTDWRQVSAGAEHTAAVRSNGTLWAWGCNSSGQLGDGTITSRSSPVSVVGGFTDWCQVSAGVAHTAAIRSNGTLWAWGSGFAGGLGDGTTTSRSSPVSVVGGFTDWCFINAGNSHTAAVRQNGTLWAWGSNSSGQLGDGTTVNRSSPVCVVGIGLGWSQVTTTFEGRAFGLFLY